MAKIILNVELVNKQAVAGLTELQKKIKEVADSLIDVKPNKELTAQIKALSEYYKSLATAAKSASEQTKKQSDEDAKAAINAAKVAKAEIEKTAAAAKAKKADEDAAAAAARKAAAEIKAAEAAEKHRAAQERRAAAAEKLRKADEEEEKPLWNLEKAYASLYARITSAAEKYPILADVLGRYGAEIKKTHVALVEYNRGRSDEIEETDVLKERYDRLSASLASVVADTKEQPEVIRSNQEQMEKWDKALRKADEDAQSLDTRLYALLKRISNEENRYETGVFDDVKEKINGIIHETEQLDRTDVNFIDREKELASQTSDVVNELTKIEATADHAAPAVDTLGAKFGDLIAKYAKFYASSLLVRKPLELIKNALDDVGETLVKTENAVIEINRVLDDPQPTQEVSNRLYDLAYQYGSTFESAATIASNFARAGRSWADSLKATEAALLAMNVAELNATEASDGLLSIIAQFDMEASDLVDVVDKLNKTADKNPVSTQKLLQAIQRAGSAAKNANISFDQTLGLITSISEATTRSGQNIGTAINSLIQYSTKNVDVFATLSAESEAVVDRFKTGLASIVDVWNQVAIDIKGNKKARDNIISALGTDGLEELSSTLHDELGDLVSEIDGVYNVANTYRKNYFIALLDNMDRYMKVQEQLTDYQGYSQEENQKYMETYTAKVNQLNDAWRKLANDEQGILGFKKSLVEIGINLVGFAEQTGGVVDTVKNLAGIIGGFALITRGESLLQLLISIRDVLGESISELGTVLSGAAGGFQATIGWIGALIAVSSTLNTTINGIRASQAEKRKEDLLALETDKDTINALSELKKKHDEETLSLEEEWELEEKIVPLLGDKGIALDGLAKHTEKYTEKVWELVEGLREEQKLIAEMAQDAAKDDYIEAARQALEDAAKASAKKDGLIPSFILNTKLGSFFTNLFSGIGMDDLYGAEEYYVKIQKLVEEAKQDYLDARGTASDSDLKKLREYYEDVLQIFNDLTKARAEYEKQNREAQIAELEATDNLTEAQKSTLATLKAINEEHIIGRAGNIPVIEETTEAVDIFGESLEGISDSFDKTKGSAEEFTEYVTQSVDKYLSAANAVRTITEAQREYSETGTLSLETVQKLAKLGDEWVDVLFDETGAVDVNTTAVREQVAAARLALQEQGYSIDAAKEEADAVGEVTDKLKDYSAQIDEVQSSLSTLDAIQKEYDETGSLSIDTLQKILDLGAEYIDLLIDENGQISLNTQAVEDLKEEKKNLIDKLIEENTAQYALSLIQELAAEKEKEVGVEAGNAALGIGTLISQLMTLKGESGDAVLYLDDLRASLAAIGSEMGISLTQEELDSVISKSRAYYDKLHSAFSYTDTSGGWQSSSGSSGSSSSSTKDQKLEELKSVVSLRESELTLMEHQGATQDAQIAKIREIQAGLSAEADYLRSIGASQEDINKLSSEWWKWQEKINKFGEDAAKAAQKAAEEQKKAAEDAAKAAQKAAEEARKAEEERIRAETARKKQDVTNAKAALTLMEKQGKSVSERVEKMKEIQNLLHIEAEWLRQIKAEQADIDALSAEWWDWQEKILKLYKETLDAAKQVELEAQQKIIDGILKEIQLEEEALDLSEKRLAVDEARANLEEAIAKAKIDYVKSVLSDYLTALDNAETLEEKMRAVAEARERVVQAEQDARAKAIIDAFKAEKDVKSDALSLDEKRLAVEKARQALIDAENNRTTRVYNEASGQWEYQANARNVQSAKDNLAKAVEALNSYVEEQAWNEVAEAVENGSVSEAEVLEILSKWAKESYGNGTPEFVAKIQAAFRKAMGTPASPESLSGQVSAVDNAVRNLNEYLKQEAVRELERYIAAGNTDFAGMRSIMDKWLSMGEGGEIYEWRDGLLAAVSDAIRSNYYDDAAVQSQVQAVENAVTNLHDYLRNQFIRDIENLVKNGTAEEIRDAIEVWSEQFDMSETDRDWANRLADAREEYDRTESRWNGLTDGQHTDEEKAWVIGQMKENSRRWWMAPRGSQEQKELEDLNWMLGTSMGWERRGDGHWYDANGEQVYDRGGILRGRGGIKATGRPEAVLDPDLTAKILQPRSEEQFRAFADAMHLMFERGPRTRAEMPVIRTPAVTDSHNTSYTVNGIPIAQNMAERYTIAELFRAMPTARA